MPTASFLKFGKKNANSFAAVSCKKFFLLNLIGLMGDSNNCFTLISNERNELLELLKIIALYRDEYLVTVYWLEELGRN